MEWGVPVGRPGSRAAVRHLGATPRRPLRPGRVVGGPEHGGRSRRRHPTCSCGATSARSARPHAATSPAGPACRRRRSTQPSRACGFAGSSTKPGARWWIFLGAPLPDEDTPAPVRFLPTWDATLLVHARRTQILPEPLTAERLQHQDPALTSRPSWSMGRWPAHGGSRMASISLAPLRTLSRPERRALDDEAERLAAFMS